MSAALAVVAVIEVTGGAGTLALLVLPLLLVAAIIYATVTVRRSERRRTPTPPEMLRAVPKADVALPDEAPTAAPAEPEPAIAPPPPVVKREPHGGPVTRSPWSDRIATAEAKGDGRDLAALYLGWARDEIAGGNAISAGDHLRTAVRHAAQMKQPDTHADARLELAALARDAGDLTTACEHWQIARALFHDLKLAEKATDTERHMQRHGCPTDWVLNDF